MIKLNKTYGVTNRGSYMSAHGEPAQILMYSFVGM